MQFHFSFYSSILLIFFSQGIAFSFLLLKKGILLSDAPSKWLSFFIFLGTLYLLPWMLGFAGWYGPQPYRDIMFYIPFQQLLLIGPVIYFYTQSLLNPSFSFGKKDILHFLPAFAYLIYSIVVFLTDKIILKQYYFYANGRDKDLDPWYQVAGIISMSIYFVMSLSYYGMYRRLIFQTLSFADTVLFRWIKKYLMAFLLMQLLRVLFILLFPDWGNFSEKWWYYLFFSCLLYYIGITGYTNNVKAAAPIPEQHELSESNLAEHLPQISFNIEQDVKQTSQEELSVNPFLEVWKSKIIFAIESDKLFQNPTLTLADLALTLNTNQTTISRMINQGFKMNFNDCINYYRVEAVKELLLKGAHRKQTLLGIALDCGFNSKTTFNRCFKSNTGLSPKEFIQTMDDGADSDQSTG